MMNFHKFQILLHDQHTKPRNLILQIQEKCTWNCLTSTSWLVLSSPHLHVDCWRRIYAAGRDEV